MPKSIVIEPTEVFSKSSIHLRDIPVNTYDRPIEEELAHYSSEDFRAKIFFTSGRICARFANSNRS
jgi:hypothetical protein